MSEKIVVSGTGCALADYLFTDIKFDSPGFQKYLSNTPGDGGLSRFFFKFGEGMFRIKK